MNFNSPIKCKTILTTGHTPRENQQAAGLLKLDFEITILKQYVKDHVASHVSLVASSHIATHLRHYFFFQFCAFTKALEEKGREITTFSLHVQIFRQLFYIFYHFATFTVRF